MNGIFIPKIGKSGQVGLPQILSLVIMVFLVYTIGRILFNATVLDPDSNDGGVLNSQLSQVNQVNPLTNIGLVVMSAIVILAAMASVVIRFF